eukprot:scaffold28121_cov75-Cyclotella_meneghiniana.AAC.3
MMMMNSNGPAADITLSHILQENTYPTANANGNDASTSGLHHRGGQQLQSTHDESFTLSNNSKRQDEHLKIIPFYILPCFSFGYGDSGRSNVKTACALIFVPLFLLFFFLLDDLGRSLSKNIKIRSNINYLSGSTKYGSLSQVQNLVFQRETLNVWPQIHRQVLVRQPEITLQIRGVDVEAMMKCPRGVLFLFHGCGRYAASFYYSPQGRRIISTANEAGLITVAVEKNEELACWDSQNDFDVVKSIATKFLKSRVKSCVNEQGEYYYPPIFGFGASSGGTFVGELASQMSTMRESFEPFVFDAVNIQIMAPTPGRRWDIPTVFTLMDGDERTKLAAEQSIPTLQTSSQKGSAFQILMTSGRKKITNLHFAYAFQDDNQMNPELSNAIYRDLVGYGILDDTGALTGNPRNRKEDIDIIWQKYLNDRLEEGSNSGTNDVTPFGVSKKLMQRLKKEELEDAHSIWLIEELNMAWDEHEITAEHFDEVITFFMDNAVKESLVPRESLVPSS